MCTIIRLFIQLSVCRFVCVTVVSCPALVLRLVSSTETSVGTVVNVSCPAGQKLQTGHEVMKTLCLRSGDWSPQVPDCVGKLYVALHLPVIQSVSSYNAPKSLAVLRRSPRPSSWPK